MTPIQDETEDFRRRRLVDINSMVEADAPVTERKRLEAKYGQIAAWYSVMLTLES